MDLTEQRGEIIRNLQDVPVERALDAARSRLFRLLAEKT
jgi:hypothetical protein